MPYGGAAAMSSRLYVETNCDTVIRKTVYSSVRARAHFSLKLRKECKWHFAACIILGHDKHHEMAFLDVMAVERMECTSVNAAEPQMEEHDSQLIVVGAVGQFTIVRRDLAQDGLDRWLGSVSVTRLPRDRSTLTA
jgi:hypothetical protein